MQSENIPNPPEDENISPTDVDITPEVSSDTDTAPADTSTIVEVPPTVESQVQTMQASISSLWASIDILSRLCLAMEAVLKVICERTHIDASTIIEQAEKDMSNATS